MWVGAAPSLPRLRSTSLTSADVIVRNSQRLANGEAFLPRITPARQDLRQRQRHHYTITASASAAAAASEAATPRDELAAARIVPTQATSVPSMERAVSWTAAATGYEPPRPREGVPPPRLPWRGGDDAEGRCDGSIPGGSGRGGGCTRAPAGRAAAPPSRDPCGASPAPLAASSPSPQMTMLPKLLRLSPAVPRTWPVPG